MLSLYSSCQTLKNKTKFNIVIICDCVTFECSYRYMYLIFIYVSSAAAFLGKPYDALMSRMINVLIMVMGITRN